MKHLYIILLTLTSHFCYGTTTKVARVIDGDTFEIESGEKVRLIGINAPEISDVFGLEAKQHLESLIDGKIIDLQNDNLSNDHDRYSRLLRYIIIDGIDINEKMISDGYAIAYLKFRFKKSSEYKAAQISASKNNVGMWGNEKSDSEIKQRANKEDLEHSIFSKVNFVISLLVILLIIGIYYYLKKY